MSGFAFDPWTALVSRRERLPPAKPANPTNPPPAPGPGLAGLAALAGGHRPASKLLPGVPAAWCQGVARLAVLAAPDSITPARWAALAATSARMLREHGAALHWAGWDGLDLFGLHRSALAARTDCMGLAWLLDGPVASITTEAVMMLATGGHALRVTRMGSQARLLAVPAWDLAKADPWGDDAWHLPIPERTIVERPVVPLSSPR